MLLSLESSQSPEFILFAQHGWADTNRAIAKLANALATPKTLVVTPNLSYLKTWLRIEPLIAQVEQKAIAITASYPDTPIKIIGHSMGGLIWLEVLNRNPQLRSRIHSLVLIASPIGGADLARIIDPLGIGIGIARDLGINRREIAQRIARKIPTLVIAGDIDRGSDGTITVETTKCDLSKFVCLPGISHPALKNHPALIDIIRDFWLNPSVTVASEADLSAFLIQRLRSIPGMTDAHRRGFSRSTVHIAFDNGISIRLWTNPFQVQHVFLANDQGDYLYSGFVGWLHAKSLHQTLAAIEREYSEQLTNINQSGRSRNLLSFLGQDFGK
jgi:pimeloyl-ACP methyl ester carboxylesterase